MQNKGISITSGLLAISMLAASCRSSTVINTVPPGAKLYVEEEYVGTTPYQYEDQKITGATTRLRLEKEGYAPKNVVLKRNEEVDAGAIVAGVFLLVPFLWLQEYKATHVYELQAAPAKENGKSDEMDIEIMAKNLRELKKLRDQGILTEEEYQAKKKELLNSSK